VSYSGEGTDPAGDDRPGKLRLRGGHLAGEEERRKKGTLHSNAVLYNRVSTSDATVYR